MSTKKEELISKKPFVKHPDLVPDLYWKKWTFENLPKRNFWVTDIDSIIRTSKGCIALIEVKKGSKPSKKSQLATYAYAAASMEKNIGNELKHPLIPYTGMRIRKVIIVELTFENKTFEDGKVFVRINGGLKKEVSEEDLIKLLSFEDECLACFPEENCNCN